MNRTGDEPAATVVVLAGRVDLDAAAAEDQTYPTVTVVGYDLPGPERSRRLHPCTGLTR